MSRTATLSRQSREVEQLLSHFTDHSLHTAVKDTGCTSSERSGGLPISTSNGSLIDFDIDTSDFMNMILPFPWDDSNAAHHYTDSYHQVRSSFESSSSTTQGSHCSMKSPLLPDVNTGVAVGEPSRRSILIPDYPQDLACHRIKAYKPRPADLRTISGDSGLYSRATVRSSPSYKRSITPSLLDSFARALAAKSSRRTHTPQPSFKSSYSQDQPTTPRLSFISTVASSPASSIISPHSESEHIPAIVPASMACATVLSTTNPKNRMYARSCGPNTIASRPKQVQRNISAPLPSADYPNMINSTISSFSSDCYNLEGAFLPHRTIPKPSSSIPLPLSPEAPATPAEPPSWFDLDDDTSDKPSKHLNLPTKLSIPQLRLWAESSSKKTTPLTAPASKRRSEDSVTIAANIIVTAPDICKSASPSKEASAHVSLSSLAPSSVQTKAPKATLKKSSARSRLLVPAGSETSKKTKSQKAKVRSSSKTMKRSPGRRLRAWFRRVFG